MFDISTLPNVDSATGNLIYGVLKDDIVPGDGLGTPVRKDWVSDLVYPFYAVLNDAGVTANGSAEGATNSQFLDALKIIIDKAAGNIVGKSIRFFNSYIPISSAFPWRCMSLPDATLSTANYPTAYINELRSRKVTYDEFNTAVSAFTGTWSGSNFTLDNNPANVAMIAELYEDWLFADSPATGWRILVSGGSEYNITGFTVGSRIITVSGSPTGTSIEIYLNRILGSTTSAKHFSWAGLGLYMTGQNKITGLRRRDKFQGHLHSTSVQMKYASVVATGTSDVVRTATGTNITIGSPITDGTNGPPRTGLKTEIESATVLAYEYTGSYV